MCVDIRNGDCTELMKTLNEESVDLIVSDPPYGVGYKNKIYDDSADTIEAKIPGWYKEWYRVLKKGSYLYLFVGVKNLDIWITEGKKAGFEFKNIIAARNFNNGHAAPKNNFGSQFQPILVFSKGKKSRKLNEVDFIPTSAGWFKDKRNKNPRPFTYSYPNWIKTEWGYATAKRAGKSIHPNEKNIDLIKFLVETSSNEGDVVLDSFMGCGSTGVACVKTNRNFIGFELTTKYYQMAQTRLCTLF